MALLGLNLFLERGEKKNCIRRRAHKMEDVLMGGGRGEKKKKGKRNFSPSITKPQRSLYTVFFFSYVVYLPPTKNGENGHGKEREGKGKGGRGGNGWEREM